MRKLSTLSAGMIALLALEGCVQPPLGPTVAVMPAPYKPFEVFQQDQALCKQFASSEVAGNAEQANNQAVGGAVLGTILGAGLGAAVGGGRGAAIGAASGAVVGTAAGSGPERYAQYSIQQRYNIAYSQCMYSRGNQVPGYAPANVPPPPGASGPGGVVLPPG